MDEPFCILLFNKNETRRFIYRGEFCIMTVGTNYSIIIILNGTGRRINYS